MGGSVTQQHAYLSKYALHLHFHSHDTYMYLCTQFGGAKADKAGSTKTEKAGSEPETPVEVRNMVYEAKHSASVIMGKKGPKMQEESKAGTCVQLQGGAVRGQESSMCEESKEKVAGVYPLVCGEFPGGMSGALCACASLSLYIYIYIYIYMHLYVCRTVFIADNLQCQKAASR